ncbi:glycoside hydrolase family 88 protein, partial [Parabacteroides distasonis]|nr:glycoside hydrolase family 88 protein [Parabacteroides distasonis]
VQPVGADPKKVTRDMTELYGTGAFLMAASEIYKLADK